MSIDQVTALLRAMSSDARAQVLKFLREELRIPIHPLEDEWNTTAEAILEAIHASPDLTQRGVRGILAEATFRTVVVPTLNGWTDIPFFGDQAHDLLLRRGNVSVRVQVKQQRRERGVPKLYAEKGYRNPGNVYTVETQRTRTGKAKDGGATRPYKRNEFDVLAVCMQAVDGDWRSFVYCPAQLLLPRADDESLLKVMQPVYLDGQSGWTRAFDEAVTGAGL
ncbi:hypothetical protein [Panacagrimonas sp.]|uniref:hypothetical protein n=1 Tax=Panacagrimonas sp. TaxID=2480088 RepID=UPI003B530554